jgi:hypothetical protein
MSDESSQNEAFRRMLALQFVVGAMFLGAIIFLSVVLAVGPLTKSRLALLPLPLYVIVLIIVCIGLVARLIYIRNLKAMARREVVNGTFQPIDYRKRMRLTPSEFAGRPPGDECDRAYLVSAFRYVTLCSTAMFEGWCFLATVVYVIEGHPVSLALAVLLAASVAAHFPTQSRAMRWAEGELEKSRHAKIT